MKLWAKFSLLLGACLLLSVGTTSFVLARFFAADPEAYVTEAQATARQFPLAARTGDDLSPAGNALSPFVYTAGIAAALLLLTLVVGAVSAAAKLRAELENNARLAATVMHEVRNPLAGALCNIQLLEDWFQRGKKVESAVALEVLNVAHEETLRASNLLQNLMKFSRQDKRPREVIDLNRRLRQSLATLKAQIDSAGVELKEMLPKGEVNCRASGDQIHEVLTNLIQNAIYAMKTRPLKTLTVSLSTHRDQAVIEVKDSGSGIPAAEKAHLFEPFFTTKPISEGTGLGLAVCRSIIQSHNGKIEVESEMGKGTSFRTYLPIAESYQAAA